MHQKNLGYIFVRGDITCCRELDPVSREGGMAPSGCADRCSPPGSTPASHRTTPESNMTHDYIVPLIEAT